MDYQNQLKEESFARGHQSGFLEMDDHDKTQIQGLQTSFNKKPSKATSKKSKSKSPAPSSKEPKPDHQPMIDMQSFNQLGNATYSQ